MGSSIATLLSQGLLVCSDEKSVPWKEVSNQMDVGCLKLVLCNKILKTSCRSRSQAGQLSGELVKAVDGGKVCILFSVRECSPVNMSANQ